MKTKKSMSMLVMSMLLVSMLAFSVYAASGSANASSSSASASVSSGDPDVTGYIEVYATIGDSQKWNRDEFNGTASSGSASVTDNGLSNVVASRARGWFNGDSVAEDYWSN